MKLYSIYVHINIFWKSYFQKIVRKDNVNVKKLILQFQYHSHESLTFTTCNLYICIPITNISIYVYVLYMDEFVDTTAITVKPI